MKRAILLAAGTAAMLALGACSKTETKTTETANGTTTTTTTTTGGSAAVTTMPPARKAGLWEQTMSMPQMTQTTKMCLDEATETKMKWYATENHGRSDCSEQSVSSKLGGGWTFHSVCNVGDGGKVVSDGSATGDFGSHYHVDITSTMTGGAMAQANGTHKIAIDAVWKGPCPAGMKGGDIEMPGGMKINMLDAANPAASGGAPHYGPGHMPSQAEIAKMRAQAMEMAKSMKAQQGSQ